MSRSAIDATRFTATSPHAYSKPSPLRSAASNTFSPSSVPRSHGRPRPGNQGPPPPGSSNKGVETPAEKVARLRAERAILRESQISTWDKVVVRGRVWADIAHRFTAMGLIGFTVIAGGVTVFALGDMIIYNRRKRSSFYAEQHILLQQRLAEAREAAGNGIADEDQILLLNRERAADEAEAARKAKKGIWKSMKGLFSTEGLKQEDSEGGLNVLGEEGLRKMGVEGEGSVAVFQAEQAGARDDEKVERGIIEAVEGKRREGEKELEKKGMAGGPLDQMAEQALGTAKAKGGWTSWVTSK